MKLRHLLIMAAVLSGGLYLYYYVENNRKNRNSSGIINAHTEEPKADDVVINDDSNTDTKHETTVDYSSYSEFKKQNTEKVDNKVINSIEREKLRKQYAEKHDDDCIRSDDMSEFENYCDWRLRHIDPVADEKIYILAKHLMSEPWEVHDIQKKLEENIIDDIYDGREGFNIEDEGYDDPLIGELVLYFVERASYDLDISEAAVMEEFFRNVGLFDCLSNNKGDIAIETQPFLECVADIRDGDCYEVSRSIFGDAVIKEVWSKETLSLPEEEIWNKRMFWNQYQSYLNKKYDM